jgi:cell wall-associated NlpC family hydrolase
VFRWFAAGTAAAVALTLALIFLVSTTATPSTASPDLSGGPSTLALADIPPSYLVLYLSAAQTCPGLPWGILAGIGKVESDHGQSDAPGVHSGANFAGAEGPMQFEPATFAEFAVRADPSVPLSVYDSADAIYTAAAMLCANGADAGTPDGINQAIFAYNHSRSYVATVLAWAAQYTTPAPGQAAATAISFALGQLGKPYQWGADGPNAYDCSGLVYAAYAAAGVRIARTTFQWHLDGPQIPLNQIEPGDLLFSAGSDGTPANPGHVVMYLGGGQIIQAPQTGQDVQVDPLDLAGVVVATRPADLAPAELPVSSKEPEPMRPVTISQLRKTATVDLMTAAAALGLGRTRAYQLVRRNEFPCRVIRIGDTYRVPTPGLLELLGVSAESPATSTRST